MARAYHAGKTFTGRHVYQSFPRLRQLVQEYQASSLLDYGCGKGQQMTERDITLLKAKDDTTKTIYPTWKEALGVQEYAGYDPACPPFDTLPTGQYDGVLSVDTLMYVPVDDVPWVLREVFSFARSFVFLSIACYPARKKYADGSNVNRTIANFQWWVNRVAAAGNDFPGVFWDVRLESEADPMTHRRFAGQGLRWGTREIWWPTIKPKAPA
jgi:hypothetical protein